MKRPVLLAVAAAVYLTTAWMVAPGFYDGFVPPSPYNWISPPPQAVAGNRQPSPGHLDMKVLGGVSDANSAFTDDGQVGIGFLPGAFDPTGKTTISIDIKPVATFPSATGLHFATNVYLITADAPLVKGANLVLLYSDLVPAPSFVYLAPDATSPWASIGGAEGQPFTIQVTTNKLGYFAAGYPEGATTKPSATSQVLPIAVALLIVGVLLAGIPLAMVRRRRAAGDEGDEEEEEETKDET